MIAVEREARARPSFGALVRSARRLPPAYYGIAILFVAAAAVRPVLLAPGLFLAIVQQSAPLATVSIGQALVMRCRSIDLSIGGIFVGADFIATSGTFAAWPGYAIVGSCLAFGVAIGVLNAFLVTIVRASAVIVTLAMSIVLVGLVVSLSYFAQPGEVPEVLKTVGSGYAFGVPSSLLVLIAVALPMAFVLSRTVFGKYVAAVGANPTAAALSGIPYVRVVFVAHVLCATWATIGGLLLAGFVGMGATNLGQDLVLNSIAAVILGGINFGGGSGGTLGPIFGFAHRAAGALHAAAPTGAPDGAPMRSLA